MHDNQFITVTKFSGTLPTQINVRNIYHFAASTNGTSIVMNGDSIEVIETVAQILGLIAATD